MRNACTTTGNRTQLFGGDSLRSDAREPLDDALLGLFVEGIPEPWTRLGERQRDKGRLDDRLAVVFDRRPGLLTSRIGSEPESLRVPVDEVAGSWPSEAASRYAARSNVRANPSSPSIRAPRPRSVGPRNADRGMPRLAKRRTPSRSMSAVATQWSRVHPVNGDVSRSSGRPSGPGGLTFAPLAALRCDVDGRHPTDGAGYHARPRNDGRVPTWSLLLGSGTCQGSRRSALDAAELNSLNISSTGRTSDSRCHSGPQCSVGLRSDPCTGALCVGSVSCRARRRRGTRRRRLRFDPDSYAAQRVGALGHPPFYERPAESCRLRSTCPISHLGGPASASAAGVASSGSVRGPCRAGCFTRSRKVRRTPRVRPNICTPGIVALRRVRSCTISWRGSSASRHCRMAPATVSRLEPLDRRDVRGPFRGREFRTCAPRITSTRRPPVAALAARTRRGLPCARRCRWPFATGLQQDLRSLSSRCTG